MSAHDDSMRPVRRSRWLARLSLPALTLPVWTLPVWTLLSLGALPLWLLGNASLANANDDFDDQVANGFVQEDPIMDFVAGTPIAGTSFATWSFFEQSPGDYAYRIAADASYLSDLVALGWTSEAEADAAGPSRADSIANTTFFGNYVMAVDVTNWSSPTQFVLAARYAPPGSDGQAIGCDATGCSLVEVYAGATNYLDTLPFAMDSTHTYRLVLSSGLDEPGMLRAWIRDLTTNESYGPLSAASAPYGLFPMLAVQGSTRDDAVSADFDNFFASSGGDTDNDGLLDLEELTFYGTDPLDSDTDGDGLTDYLEIVILGSNPVRVDTDGDGLCDGSATIAPCTGNESTSGTNPLIDDTDGDSLLDGVDPFPTTPSLLIVDDFADGDAAGWSEVDNPGVTEAYAVVAESYEIAASANAQPLDPPRAGANRLDANAVYADFASSVDLVDVGTDPTTVLGIRARKASGSTEGYALIYSSASDGLLITRLEAGVTTVLASALDIGLDANNDFRLIFEAVGEQITGRVYQLPELVTPVAEIQTLDSSFTIGGSGLFVIDGSGTGNGNPSGRFDNVRIAPYSDADTDADGLLDVFEILTSGTNPALADSDGDGVSDGTEIAAGSDPNDASDSTVAQALPDTTSILKDAAATPIDVLANDSDLDGAPTFTIAWVTQPANGTVVVDGDALGLSYEPDPGYCNDGSPTDDFDYALTPGGSTATVAVTVSCAAAPAVPTLTPFGLFLLVVSFAVIGFRSKGAIFGTTPVP